MYGRIANARSAARITDAATTSLRRRMALAVAKRFSSTSQPVIQPKVMVPQVLFMPTALEGKDESVDGAPALDQRVRETGEW